MPGAGPQQGRQYLDERRFASSVAAEQAEYFSRPHLQTPVRPVPAGRRYRPPTGSTRLMADDTAVIPPTAARKRAACAGSDSA